MSLPAGLFLIDTSALARDRIPAVRMVISAVIESGAAATCGTVDLEVGYSARNADEIDRVVAARRDLFTTLPMSQAIMDEALRTQVQMARRGLHRAAGGFDLITAAVAHAHQAVVLHYDADFEYIASVTGQPHRWVVPRGSID